MNTPQKEILENLVGEKMPDPTPQLIREPIPGSPFWIIQTETGFNLTMGKYRINKEELTTKEELIKWLEQNA